MIEKHREERVKWKQIIQRKKGKKGQGDRKG